MMTLQELGPLLDDPYVLLALGVAGVVVLLILLSLRASLNSAKMIAPLSTRVETLADNQQRLDGRLSQVSEAQGVAQTQILTSLEKRLEEVSRNMGETLQGAATRTARSLGDLERRLETIDKAQTNIEKLSGDVLGLQDILSNKQARGAFGEIQLEAIVGAALPRGSFSMQAQLSNGRRVDCLIDLPDPPGPIGIDSKFPLEPYEALVAAANPAEKQAAGRAMRAAVRAHIKAISERYIIEGETSDGALMFVPSEAVYAELHASFSEIVREAFAARVWIVSPTTCMATLTTLRAVLKDVRLREQTALIRRELGLLSGDLSRMGQRMDNLDRHFTQTSKDLIELRTSADKAGKRAQKLEAMEFEEQPQVQEVPKDSSVRIFRPDDPAA